MYLYFILNLAKTSIVFCEDSDKAEKLMRNRSFIKCIIVMNNFVKYAAHMKAQEMGVKLIEFELASQLGSMHLQKPIVSFY